MYCAAYSSNVEVFNYLLDAGFDLIAADKSGKTILDYGSISMSLVMIKRILKTNCLDNNCSPLLWPPLHWAHWCGDFEIVKSLNNTGLKMFYMVTLKPPAIWTLLDIALYCGNRNLISNYSSVTEGHTWLEVVLIHEVMGLNLLQTKQRIKID